MTLRSVLDRITVLHYKLCRKIKAINCNASFVRGGSFILEFELIKSKLYSRTWARCSSKCFGNHSFCNWTYLVKGNTTKWFLLFKRVARLKGWKWYLHICNILYKKQTFETPIEHVRTHLYRNICCEGLCLRTLTLKYWSCFMSVENIYYYCRCAYCET